jgi:hypothetical protein
MKTSNLRLHSAFRIWFYLYCCRFAPAVILFWLSTSICLAQEPYGQVSFEANNKTIRQVLDDISFQTGYQFTYDPLQLDDQQTVSLSLTGVPLMAALDSIITSPEMNFRIIDRNIVIFRGRNSAREPVSSDSLQYSGHIRGLVTDHRSGKPLPFATVALHGTSQGTITNLSGIFSMEIPPMAENPVLVVSFIGYRNQIIPLQNDSSKILRIKMQKEVVSLQEVIIRYQDPLQLVNDAIEKIPQNYLSVYSGMEAYYRESVRRNNKLMVYSEAVLEIAKEPYDLQASSEKVRIIRGRRIRDVNQSDSVLLKIRSGIGSALLLDIAKNQPDFLYGNYMNFYSYEFADVVSYRNRLAYLIRFQPKPEARDAFYKGQLYLDMQNLTILAADFEIDDTRLSSAGHLFTVKKSRNLNVRPVSAQYHTEYRESDGRYYLSQVRAEVSFKLRKRRTLSTTSYKLAIEMAVTKVDAGTRLRFRQNESIDHDAILSELPFTNNPDFWGGYSIIEPEATLQSIIERMQETGK